MLGYEVSLLFYFLPSVEMAIERVKLRVSKGGHHIPSDIIERRYILGIRYFFEYIEIVDRWHIFESHQTLPVKIAEGQRNEFENIINFDIWQKLKHL